MRGATYIKYSELFDRKPRLSTIEKKLSRLNRSNVIFHLSRINVLFGREKLTRSGREAMQELQRLLVDNFFDRRIIEQKLFPRFGEEQCDERPIFHRQQVLALIRLAALVCSEETTLAADGKTPGGYELGLCCLMMNDHLVSAKEERAISRGSKPKRRKHLGLQLGPSLELANPPRLIHAVARSEAIFSEILNSAAMQEVKGRQLSGSDLARTFSEAASGLTIEQYRELTLGVLSWLIGHPREEIIRDAGKLVFERAQFISGTLIRPEDFDHYLALDAVGISELGGGFDVRLLPQWDFVRLRNRPLIDLDHTPAFGEDAFICADVCFVAEKLSAGIYWPIIDSLASDKKKQREAFSAFGRVFEIYVNGLLGQVPTLSGPFIPSPKYENGDQAVDAVVCGRNHLILLEHKASFINVKAKLSGKVKAFDEDFDKKFGAGRGVAQLADHIARMFPRRSRGESDEAFRRRAERGRIGELDRILRSSHARVERVTPVLVVWESYLRLPPIVQQLNARLARFLKRGKVKGSIEVAPLTVIDVDTLETMMPNLLAGDFTLEQCLNARALRDPEYSHTLHDFLSDSDDFPEYDRRVDEQLEAKVEKIFKRVKLNFFGESTGWPPVENPLERP